MVAVANRSALQPCREALGRYCVLDMSTRTTTIVAFVLASVLAPASSALASDFSFKPFTDLSSVCPKCEPPPGDVLTFKDGRTVHGRVVAMNPSFYTLERFGEVRMAARDEVQSVQWRQGRQTASLEGLDQIVLNNGHVLTGTIVSEASDDRVLKSTIINQTYRVAVSETAAIFKKGALAR